MTGNSTISVIIPVYNGERFLAAAIQGVLDQTLPPDEIIVVDDGSTDGSAAVVAGLASASSLPIRYVYQINQGPAAARNRGIDLAKGEYIAFLDADDWWHPHKLQRQMDSLVHEPELGYVLCHMDVQMEADIVWPLGLNQAHYQSEPPCFLPSALLVRRSTLEQVGPFDESYRFSDDADWFLRAKDASIRFVVLPEILIVKRIHATNLSHSPAMVHETLRAFHASTRRQRRAPQQTKAEP